MSVLSALLQGILQGLTEFLPISSSGHLSLFQHFFGLSGEQSLFFNLMLHLGTLAAVIAAYFEDLWAMIKEFGAMCKELFTRQFKLKTDNPNRQMFYMLVLGTLPMVLVIPFRGFVAQISGDNDIIFEGVCFLFTSLLLFGACRAKPGKAGIGKMRPMHALIIGFMQDIASLPGVSRSGSTISTGMILGFDRAMMVKYSFLLGIPAILGGAVFEIGDAFKEGIQVDFLPVFAGMLAAAVVGYVCIYFVRWLLRTDRFIVFAWYTLLVGVAVVVIGIVQHFIGSGTPEASVVSSASQIISSTL